MQKPKYNIRRAQQCDEEESEFMGFGPQFKNRIWQAQLENFREIVINGEINDDLIEKAVLQIMNINRYDQTMEETVVDYKREPITIMINSGGGDLAPALSLCAAMEMSRTPIHTVALGQACSAAFLILICGDTRFAQHYSRLMYHTGTSGYIGVITDILEHGDYLEGLNESIHQMVMKHTGISEEQLDDVFARKTDWYLSIPDAIELGVIDCIWGVPMEQMWPETAEDEEDDPCDPCAMCEVAGEEDPDICEACDVMLGKQASN